MDGARSAAAGVVGAGRGVLPTTKGTAAPTPGQDPTDNPTLTDTASGWETGCRNGLRDGDQEPDCRDPDCADACTEDCAGGADQDLDALIDWLDPDCSAVCLPDCASEYDGDVVVGCDDSDCDGMRFEQCADDRDNDGDGRVDCADSDCACTYELGDEFGQVTLDMDVGELFYATNHVAVTAMDGDGVPDIFVARTEILWDGSAPKSFAALGPWGSSDRTFDDAIARFDCGLGATITSPIGAPDPNKDGLGEVAVTCNCGGALPSVVAILQIPPDVRYPTLEDALAIIHYDNELDGLVPQDVVTETADGNGMRTGEAHIRVACAPAARQRTHQAHMLGGRDFAVAHVSFAITGSAAISRSPRTRKGALRGCTAVAGPVGG